MKGLAISMGLGVAAGAVAILMMPRNHPTRKLAGQGDCKVEDAALKATQKLTQKMDM